MKIFIFLLLMAFLVGTWLQQQRIGELEHELVVLKNHQFEARRQANAFGRDVTNGMDQLNALAPDYTHGPRWNEEKGKP